MTMGAWSMSDGRSRGERGAFFEPESVAIIGASRDPSKVGGSVVANMRAAGFEGRILPVNPTAHVVQGLPATASLLAIDGPVDLAVIAVPAPAVLPVLISHKTDVGGVTLGLTSPTDVAHAAALMLARVRARRPDAAIRGIVVQPMAPPGKELLLGAVRDPQFGPLVMVGLGGIYVEVLRDTATRLAPVSPAEALRMLDELKTAALLRGVRGEPPVDRTAVAEAICRVARLRQTGRT
jgi:acyl-CoA synthetase (NDP forming)